ncbi:hypothetical protein ThimaDRAFT_4275 [Thiocapsa marina 5811]|uniref:Uncharacterized protein n=1 Tax=Thiocapsa marina 5811 TaxID=768671 RepID=F9UH08_9GAMM|nr:hypothetical protein ThimaDRAFT_4275 [Thiocapsa marina 5811]
MHQTPTSLESQHFALDAVQSELKTYRIEKV